MACIDGNTAALNQYQRSIDEAVQVQVKLEANRKQLSDDLFDGYMSNNHCVIDEVDARMVASTDAVDNMITKLRENWTLDGTAMRTAYMKIIACVCDEIASEYSDMGKAYDDFSL